MRVKLRWRKSFHSNLAEKKILDINQDKFCFLRIILSIYFCIIKSIHFWWVLRRMRSNNKWNLFITRTCIYYRLHETRKICVKSNFFFQWKGGKKRLTIIVVRLKRKLVIIKSAGTNFVATYICDELTPAWFHVFIQICMYVYGCVCVCVYVGIAYFLVNYRNVPWVNSCLAYKYVNARGIAKFWYIAFCRIA